MLTACAAALVAILTVLDAGSTDAALQTLNEAGHEATVIGEVEAGAAGVRFR